MIHYFNEYRKQGPLSGQKLDDIVLNVERLMKRQKVLRTEAIKNQQVSSFFLFFSETLISVEDAGFCSKTFLRGVGVRAKKGDNPW